MEALGLSGIEVAPGYYWGGRMGPGGSGGASRPSRLRGRGPPRDGLRRS